MPSQRRTGIVLGYANIIVKNLVNLIYTPMLLAFVGQADYGVYQTSYSFVFTLTLLSFGFSQAYVRFFTQKKLHGTQSDIHRLNGVYLVLYATVSAVALLLGLGFATNAGVFFSDSFTSAEVDLVRAAMSVMAGSIAVSLFNSVFDAYVLAHEEFHFQQSRQLLTTLATPFCAYILLLFGMGVVGVAIAQLAVNIVLLTLNAAYCIGYLGMRFDVRHFDSSLFRSIAIFSVWIFANQICDLVNQNVPNVLLGALTSAMVVAVFAVSVQIRNVFISLSVTISNVFTPEINRIVTESDDNAILTRLMTRVGRCQMILFCWVYGGFVLLGKFFIEHWAGEGFADAYWLVLIMVAPLMVSLAQNTGIEIQRAKNLHRSRSIAMLVTAVLSVAFTAIASPVLGYWAPAIAYFVGELLCKDVFMNWYYQQRVGLDMRFFWKRCLPIIFAAVVATAICTAGSFVFLIAGWFAFFVWGIVYTILFAALVWFIAFDSRERAVISSRIRQKNERRV